MATISITDLTNAKLDTDHIADIATSLELTATDRLGTTKKTLQGAIDSIAAIDVKGAWATTTAYVVKDAVKESGTWYICIEAHTSGTFATDLAAGKWSILQITDATLTRKRETRQIATAGQTVFDLVDFSYQPGAGINNITVMVNGVVQFTPEDYAETSSTRITFVDGLAAGDAVDFFINDAESEPFLNSDNVVYNNDGTTVSDALLSRTRVFDTIADALSSEMAILGSTFKALDYATGNNSGILNFKWVAAGTGTVDNAEFFDHDTLPLQAQQIFGDIVSLKQFGAIGDGVADDTASINAASSYCIANNSKLYIPRATYYMSGKWQIAGRIDIDCDPTALIRWDSVDENNTGILLLFDGVQLCELNFPCLYGPAINSSFLLPGYGSGTQDPTTRIGNAVQLKGGNRININVHIANGFKTTFLPQSTVNQACDNVNFTINTSDFCERFVHADSTEGFGIAELVVKANTVWAKRIFSSNTTTGYINASRIEVQGGAFVNEKGGCAVYTVGTGLRSSTVFINQVQSGTRDDSRNDEPVTLVPTGAMAATPVEGETITQSGSGATGVVVTNAYYTMTSSGYFTVENVTGTFDTVGQLTGSTSGALGANSVPSEILPLVCPLVGGDQTMNTAVSDAEQTGTIGYFGGNHCDITIGMPFDSPTGATTGAFSLFPKRGESVRIRDNGKHNKISIQNAYAEGDDGASTAITLSGTIGENNFDGGVGSAKYADYVYCSASVSALAAGAYANFFLYHGRVSDNLTLLPVSVIPKNDGIANNNIEIVAFADSGTNNRQIRVKVFNRSASPVTATLYFFVRVGS